jgi:L-ascorbate metabolism protein UlaG (beta-lactamase superfamily)
MKFNQRGRFLRPFFRSGRFYNNHKEQDLVSRQGYLQTSMYLFSSFLKELKMVIKSVRAGEKRLPKDITQWLAPTKISRYSQEPVITWIGHSTFLIQINKKNILTDPIFGSPSFFFPRILPPGIEPQNLPKIDYVLISHNHFDHMDSKSLLFLHQMNPNINILVPEGDQHWFKKRNFKNVFGSAWWKKHFFESISFTFLPAFHWSQRGIFDRNRSLWGSWMIQSNDQSIYFAGDTAYSHHFKAISLEFKQIDIAIMPIGPCEPRKYMFDTHINAEEAGEAFLDLNAQRFIPMHWGTFHFGIDSFETPIKRINKWWKKNRSILKNKILFTPKFGESISFGNNNLPKAINKHLNTNL